MRLFVKLIIILIIPFLLILGFGVYKLQILLDIENSEIYKNIDLRKKLIQEYLVSDNLDLMKAIAFSLEHSKENVDAIVHKDNDLLFRQSKNFISNNIKKIFITDENNLIIARGHDEFKFGDFLPNLPLKEQNTFFGIWRIDGIDSLTYGVRVFDKNKRYIGNIVISIDIDTKFLNDAIKEQNVILTYHSKYSPLITSKALDANFVKKVVLDLPLDKSSVTEALFNANFYSTKEAEQVKYLRLNVFVPLLVMLLCSPFLIFLVLFYHLRPYNDLIDMLKKFSLKEIGFEELSVYTKQIGINKKHEISNIASALHEMASVAQTKLQQMEELATIDFLTGIYNRFKLEKILNLQIKKTKRYRSVFSVIIFDIDHFKKVNDHFGHMVGDQVLCEIALRTKQNIRETDFFGRWGGEEFMVICENTDAKGAETLACILQQKIAQEKICDISISASFGVSAYSGTDSWDYVVRRADEALYKAKNSGRNKVIVYEESL